MASKPRALKKRTTKAKEGAISPNYSESLIDDIIMRISNGESLTEICAEEGYPNKSTFRRWLENPNNSDLRDAYAQAVNDRVEHWAEQIIDIADDSTGDVKIVRGEEVCDNEFVQRSKLRIDARKWLMSKLAPKKYGDKVALVGDNDSDPVRVVNSTMSTEEAMDAYKQMLERTNRR